MRTALRNRQGRGFTLVEAVAVMAILGIVSAVVAPGLQQLLSAQRVKGLAQDLVADLLLARSEALKRNVGVQLTPTESRWDKGWTMTVPSQSLSLRSRNTFNEAFQFDGAPALVSFQPNGRVAQPAAAMRMTVGPASGETGQARCVELDLAGRARVSVGVCR